MDTSFGKRVRVGVLSLCWGASAAAVHGQAPLVIRDGFDRILTTQPLQLVDWEGELANPVAQFTLQAPAGAVLPLVVTITSSEPRFYFVGGGAPASAAGVSRVISLGSSDPELVEIALFPDRDGVDEFHTLTLTTEGGGAPRILPVRVIDQDRVTPTSAHLQVDVTFTQDQTGFFSGNANHRTVVQQAVQDWAYFFTNQNPAIIAAGAEQTFIWNQGGYALGGAFISNATAYQGFRLHVSGMDADLPDSQLRSGGAPSLSGFQQIAGVTTNLRRSGTCEIEVKGNYNTLGWMANLNPQVWWQATNLGDVSNDLYSIARHEAGHALFFNSGYPAFAAMEAAGLVSAQNVVAYHMSAIGVSTGDDHFPGVQDRLSKRGIFGNEYDGSEPLTPWGRWLITKLDLLLAQEIGYPLRPTSAFKTIEFVTTAVPRATLGTPYHQTLLAAGGVPGYDWEIVSGALPAGLSLDRFTGVISGIPTASADATVMIRLRDADLADPYIADAEIRIVVGSQAFGLTTVNRVAGGQEIRFSTITQGQYHVQASPNLDGAWTTISGAILGTGGELLFTDTDVATIPRRFYRVLELLP